LAGSSELIGFDVFLRPLHDVIVDVHQVKAHWAAGVHVFRQPLGDPLKRL
jgi:hypothetical protein